MVRRAPAIAFSHAGKFSVAFFKTLTLLPDTSGAPAARENACSARIRRGVVTACLWTGARELFTARHQWGEYQRGEVCACVRAAGHTAFARCAAPFVA